MLLDPNARVVLDLIAKAEARGQPKVHEGTADEGRKIYRDSRRALSPQPPEVAKVENFEVSGPAGPIPVRLYRPADSPAEAALPVLIYYHGGGWVIGDLDTHDVVCRQLANDGGFAVLSVDYRLAPEHRFPAAVDDAYAALAWVARDGRTRGLDTTRIAVSGDSAGGNLAAVASLLAREQAGPKIAFQALIYPATNMERNTPSHAEFAEGFLLTKDAQVWFQQQYLSAPQDRDDWRASPLKAPDLSALPPALILTAGYDPLRDEGQAYADRLTACGVRTAYHCYAAQIHGFITMGKIIGQANEALAEVAGAVSAALGDKRA